MFVKRVDDNSMGGIETVKKDDVDTFLDRIAVSLEKLCESIIHLERFRLDGRSTKSQREDAKGNIDNRRSDSPAENKKFISHLTMSSGRQCLGQKWYLLVSGIGIKPGILSPGDWKDG